MIRTGERREEGTIGGGGKSFPKRMMARGRSKGRVGRSRVGGEVIHHDYDSKTSNGSRRLYKQKPRGGASSSNTDSSVSDDSSIGRGVKRSEKSKRRHHEDE